MTEVDSIVTWTMDEDRDIDAISMKYVRKCRQYTASSEVVPYYVTRSRSHRTDAVILCNTPQRNRNGSAGFECTGITLHCSPRLLRSVALSVFLHSFLSSCHMIIHNVGVLFTTNPPIVRRTRSCGLQTAYKYIRRH